MSFKNKNIYSPAPIINNNPFLEAKNPYFSKNSSMKILDRYILKRFLTYLGWAFIAFLVLFYVVDLVEHIDNFIDRGAAWEDVVLYYLSYLPFIIVLISPIAILLAANFSCGQMSKNREIVAIRSGGLSSLRAALPILIFGLVWSIAVMIFGETVVPRTNAVRDTIKERRIDNKTERARTVRGLLYQWDDDRVLSAGILNARRGRGTDILVVYFDEGDQLERLIRASEMVYRGGSWQLRDGHIYEFTGDSTRGYERFVQKDLELSESPGELTEERADPDEMGFFELKKFIDRVQRAGGDPLRERTDLAMKISYPFVNFIILLFGIPLVLRFRRGGGLVIGFAQSITISFIYFGVVRVGQTLGYNGTLHPILAATIGNIIFGAGGVFLLLFYRE